MNQAKEQKHMSVGTKIKELRNKAGLTQKELADSLHVTYQAVSRWENDDAEPSIDSLKGMCKIFNCTTDELFENPTPKKEENVQVVEKVVVQESKPVLAVCEDCNKPIYEPNEVFRIEEKKRVRTRRHHHSVVTTKKVLCKACNDKRLAEEKRKKEQAEKIRKINIEKRRHHSFIWPPLVAIILLIVGIVQFVNGNTTGGAWCMVFMPLSYLFLATMILNNTKVTDIWLEVASWGFVKMPGVIFELSLDGVAWLIAVKILLWLLQFALTLLAIMFATIICMLASIFAYPSALRKNFKYIK